MYCAIRPDELSIGRDEVPVLSRKAKWESYFRLADLISREYAQVKKFGSQCITALSTRYPVRCGAKYEIVLAPIRNKLIYRPASRRLQKFKLLAQRDDARFQRIGFSLI